MSSGESPLPAPHRAPGPEDAASRARRPMALGEEPLSDVPHLLDEVGRCHARPQPVVLTQRVLEDREDLSVAGLVVAHLPANSSRCASPSARSTSRAQHSSALRSSSTLKAQNRPNGPYSTRGAQRLRELARDPSTECASTDASATDIGQRRGTGCAARLPPPNPTPRRRPARRTPPPAALDRRGGGPHRGYTRCASPRPSTPRPWRDGSGRVPLRPAACARSGRRWRSPGRRCSRPARVRAPAARAGAARGRVAPGSGRATGRAGGRTPRRSARPSPRRRGPRCS